MILELKYRQHPPAIFKRLVEEFALEPQRDFEVPSRDGANRARRVRAGIDGRGQRIACLTRSHRFSTSTAARLTLMFVRLVLAMLLGLAIAWVYRRARPANGEAESFGVTLVLLTILIAMVTQVIGDNVARAFSLVGALSIVRFRTVVRDTQDTAYVIFAVAIGMAMGANHPSVALCGLAVVGVTALLLATPHGDTSSAG